jgi:hypothetical protein
MPFTYRIDREKRRVYSTGTGEFSARDVKLLREELLKDPDFDPAFSQLADFTQLDSGEISPDEVIELARVNVFSAKARRAIVADRPLTFGMARVFAAHRASRGEAGIRVFHTVREAVAWLDDEPEEEPAHQRARRRARA